MLCARVYKYQVKKPGYLPHPPLRVTHEMRVEVMELTLLNTCTDTGDSFLNFYQNTMKAAGRRNNPRGQKKNPSVSLGSFFGACGSPIQTTKMDVSRKNGLRAKIQAPGLEDCTDSSSGEESDMAMTKRVVQRRRSIENRQGIQLDVARKAKIPLFLKSPMFSIQSTATSNSTLDTKVLPARQAHNQHINFNEMTLGRSIGEGAFGKVYEGKWKTRPVAIKMLICQDFTPEILAEFESEVEIMSVLRHPNICRLLGACMDPPHRCLVVELLSRGSMWGVLRTNRSMDEATRFGFVNDTAKGMSYLHNFQPPILHRDLKSPNLLVDNQFNIKISDFGLARVKAHVQTMTGNCGTVQWMAPEVLANQKYTEKADVFSFGIVVWEIVTGECPYDGMSQIQAALGVLNRNLRPVIPRSCPPFLAQLMKACWARQPELRPSFLQVVRALRDYSKRAEAQK